MTTSNLKSRAELFTYHCICSELVLATAQDLRETRQRAAPAADKAHIIRLFNGDRRPLATLESTVVAHDPLLIQREDGFEKRWVVHCNRCDIILGYYLDRQQALGNAGSETAATRGVFTDVFYLLPGAVVTTSDMKEGKKPTRRKR